MSLPFTVDQFLEIFSIYNQAVWPLQIVFNLLALSAIYFAFRKHRFSDRAILLSLAFFWLWMGIVYHIRFFTRINPAAWGFGSVFVVQGILFVWHAFRNKISFRATLGLRQSVGSLFILYALLIYPLLGLTFGHIYPSSPTFGAPCPTTIFTFGILLWATDVPRHVLLIPGLWSIIGVAAALTLGIREDIGLLIAGIIAVSILGLAKPQPATTP